MPQAAEAYTSNVVPFRRAANDAAPIEAVKPTQTDVQALLIAALVSALPVKAAATFRRRLRLAYETAEDPHYKAVARLAAEAMGVA